jgi:hypothetical protein
MIQADAGLLAVAFIVMILIGYFSTVLVCAGAISNRLAWALAPAIGMGICSITFLAFRRPVFTVESLLVAILFALWLRYRKKAVRQLAPTESRIPVLAAWMIGALAWGTLTSIVWIDKGPHGEWDAFAIWNSHARYIYRAGPVWLQHIGDTAHSDYPLLVPGATARVWRYIGNDVPEAAAVQALLIGIAGVAILAATLWELCASTVSFAMPLLLLATPFYLGLAVWQYADIPLSVYILSTLGLICVHSQKEPDNDRLLALAGFTAGCAAWTKNEGLLFALVIAVLLVSPLYRRPVKTMRRFAMWSLGMLLPLAVTIYFKFRLPGASDIVQNRSYDELMSKILDVGRYREIGSAFLHHAATFGSWAIHPAIPLFALLAVWGIKRGITRDGGWLTGTAALVLMLAGYFAVYVITALPVEYHLATSLDRLLMHLWPSFLLLAGLAVNTSATR